MARRRLCASCGRRVALEAKRCLCGQLFRADAPREPAPKRSGPPRCAEPSCDRIATIRVGGEELCGVHFDARHGSAQASPGSGFAVWRSAIERMRANQR